MAGNHVILESDTPKPTPATPVAVGSESVRPKAFRRPPGWVAPSTPAAPRSTTTSLQRIPTHAAQQSEPSASRDKLYGLMLLGVVVGINLMAYSLLSAWESHIKPRYTAPTLPKGGPFVEPTDGSPRDSVTLYLSPTDERRTLRIERLDMPLDTTDAIVLPPANPEDDQ